MKPVRILIIDDDPNDAALAARVLSSEPGVEARSIVSAMQFSEELVAAQFDVAVLETKVHWSDGVDLIKTLKKAAHAPAVIVFSAHATPDFLAQSIAHAIDAFVVKNAQGFLTLVDSVQAVQAKTPPQSGEQDDGPFRNLIERSSTGLLFQCTLEGRLLEASGPFVALAGVTSGDKQPAHFLDRLIPAAQRAEAMEKLRKDEYLLLKDVPVARAGERDMRCVLKAAVSTDARGRRVITGLLEVQSPAPAAGPRSVPAAAQRRVPEPVSNGVAGPKSVASPGKAPELAQKALVVAHDWKEPLRTLAHYSELLRNRYQGRLDEDADDYLSFVHDASTRMKGELLRLFADTGDSTLSPASSGSPTTLPPPEGPSDTAAAFDRAVAYLAASISATKAEVTHGPLPPIMINEEELVQILMNLLGNAIKFHGDDPPRIHLSVARTGNEWLFSVEDNGIGVTDDDLPRLFTMFERGSGGRNVSGSGIGLAVCKSIVERNGGRIWAARNGSRGSTFFFTIPTHEIGAGAPRSAPRVTSLRPVR